MAKKDNYSIRLNFYMKPDLVAVIDEYAESLGVTRGAAINIICSLWRDGRTLQDSFKSMASNMRGESAINTNDAG